MTKLIPDGELTFSSWESCKTVMDILLSEGYVLLLSREENLYVLNYIWSEENYADRNDVVFMDRGEFEDKFYEDPDYAEDDEYEMREHVREDTRKNTEREVWWYAQYLMDSSPSTIEKIFCLDQMSEETRDRFWTMYPNQLTYAEVKNRIDNYNELRNAALGERIMEEALASWDRSDKERYDEERSREAEEV